MKRINIHIVIIIIYVEFPSYKSKLFIVYYLIQNQDIGDLKAASKIKLKVIFEVINIGYNLKFNIQLGCTC